MWSQLCTARVISTPLWPRFSLALVSMRTLPNPSSAESAPRLITKGWSEPAWDGVRKNARRSSARCSALQRGGRREACSVAVSSQEHASLSAARRRGMRVPTAADINNVADEVGAKFPTVYLAGKMANAHQCGLLCAKNATCLSYTWCGPTKGRTHRIVSFGATLCGTQ